MNVILAVVVAVKAALIVKVSVLRMFCVTDVVELMVGTLVIVWITVVSTWLVTVTVVVLDLEGEFASAERSFNGRLPRKRTRF